MIWWHLCCRKLKCWVSLVFCVKLNMAWKDEILGFFWGPLGTKCSIFSRHDTSNMPRCQHSGNINWIHGLTLQCWLADKGESCCHLFLGSAAFSSAVPGLQPHSSKAGAGICAGFEFGQSEVSWKELGKGSVYGLEDKWSKKDGKCFVSIE